MVKIKYLNKFTADEQKNVFKSREIAKNNLLNKTKNSQKYNHPLIL